VTKIATVFLKRLTHAITTFVKDISNSSKYTKATITLTVVYIVFFSTYTLALHYSFKTTGWDLGSYTQSFWTTINEGKLFQTNLQIYKENPNGSYFGTHFAPILFLLLPFYAIFQSAETLLVLKAVVGGFSIIPLYLFTRRIVGNEKVALVVVGIYALNPHLLIARLFDFQEHCLLPLLIFSAYYTYVKGSYNKFLVLMVLVLAVNEFMSIMVAMFVLALLIERYGIKEVLRFKFLKDKIGVKLGLLIIISALWLLLAYGVKKQFNPEGLTVTSHFPISIEDTTPWGIVMTLLGQPDNLLKALSYDSPKKLIGILMFMAPTLALPLYSLSFVLPFIPYLAMALVSSLDLYYLFTAHYSFYVSPFLFIGLVGAMRKITRKGSSRIIPALISMSVIAFMLGSFLFISYSHIPAFDKHTEMLHKVISIVPSNASILTQNNIFPHFATRSNAYSKTFPWGTMILGGNFSNVDYILVDTNSSAWGVEWASILMPYVNEQLKSGKYGLLVYIDGIILLKRGYHGEPINPS